MTQQQVIDLIVEELLKAEKKFPSWPKDKIHAAGIVTEETGELMQACIDWEYRDKFDDMYIGIKMKNQMRLEAVQVGAMAIRFLMGLE